MGAQWGKLLITGLAGAALGVVGLLVIQQANAPDKETASDLLSAYQPYQASPEDFRLFPCTRTTKLNDPFTPCLLVMAGGKRLVFGAPQFQDWRGIGAVDALFLMNGHPNASGGVMSLRNESWVDGRRQPLRVIAGEVQLEALQAQDAGQSQGDAILKLENIVPLEFLDAGLAVKPVPAKARDFPVFNTGDLRVLASSRFDASGDQLLTYKIVYNEQTAELLACGASELNGDVDTAIFLIADKSALAFARAEARKSKLQAREVDIIRAGETCPSRQDAEALFEGRVGQRYYLELSSDEDIRDFPDFSRDGMPL